jgi:hypothetical protein
MTAPLPLPEAPSSLLAGDQWQISVYRTYRCGELR